MLETKSIKVFVSCPGDMSPEKEMIKKVCEALNHRYSGQRRRARFEVLDFRDIIGEWGGNPQELINKRFSGYDIYLGLMWMRFGTPTGGKDPATGKPYDSGTEEEFRIAKASFEAGNPIKVYFFFKTPIASGSLAGSKQLVKVQEFQEELMAGGWVNFIQDKGDVTDFNNDIHDILEDWVFKLEQQEIVEQKMAYDSDISDNEPSPNATVSISFIASAPAVEHVITRTISAFEPGTDALRMYYNESSREGLIPLVLKEQRVVLLGSAGTGKSTELANLVHHYAVQNDTLVPIFKRMNTYVDEDIEDFLPVGWKEIPEQIALVVLDGLDEVQPQHFNTAIRKISSFSLKYPALRIVVSCRTNFYDYPTANSGGSLTDFKVYTINEIALEQLPAFARSAFGVDGDAFFTEANDRDYRDLMQQPFFLTILLEKYAQHGHLRIRKVDLLNEFIERRFDFDQKHFNSTKDLKSKKLYIIGLLKKIALTMEYMGKNFLTYAQLQRVLPNADDLELIKFSTAFDSLKVDPDKWSFEHNNIQEFLAASALLDMGIEQIKKIIALDEKRIRPSWVNTLFFLMGILEEEKRQELTAWILQIEPDILVKIEPDKINPMTRYEIFQQVYNHYKTLGVWLRSNKFSNEELARFAMPKAANEFLIKELKDKSTSRHNRLNALNLIKYQQLGTQELKHSKKAVMDFMLENLTDSYAFNTGSYTLAALNLSDQATIDELMGAVGKRTNQYVRAGMYKLINQANLEGHYIDYLIEGIGISDKDQDRENVNLMDEGIQLENALSADFDILSLKKLIEFFTLNDNRRLYRFHERGEILRSLIRRAILLHTAHDEVFQLVYQLFLSVTRGHDQFSVTVGDFFTQTETELDTFKLAFKDENLGVHQKAIIYKQLLNKEIVDYVLAEYTKRNLTNADLEKFYREATWLGKKSVDDQVPYLEAQLKTHTNILVENPAQINQSRQAMLEQKSIDLYFSADGYKSEITRFFEKNSIDELTWDELFNLRKYDLNDEEEILEPAFDLLVDLLRGPQSMHIERPLKFIGRNERFEDYRFEKFKQKLSGNNTIELSTSQQKILEDWVKDRVGKADIPKAISVNQQDRDRVNYDPLVQVLWYYIEKFNIEINPDKILDFTTFDDFRRTNSEAFNFSVIESQVGREAVKARVLENLQNGIDYDTSWKNNSNYAITHDVNAAYPLILKELSNNNRSEFYRKEVLQFYFKETHDLKGLFTVLDSAGTNSIRWALVNLIIEADPKNAELNTYLHSVLADTSELESERFRSAQQLTNLNDRMGTEFYLDYMIQKKGDMELDYYYDSANLRNITDTHYLPQLMDLLYIAKTEKEHDDFNRLEPSVTESLTNIAMASEANLVEVKAALMAFIEKYTGIIEYVNFLHPLIERMEYQFYLSASQSDDINHALGEVSKIIKI